MPLLHADWANRIEAAAGPQVASFARNRAPGATGFMAQLGTAFKIRDKAAPIAIRKDDHVIDVGGPHHNDAFLAAPIKRFTPNVLAAVADVVRYPATAENTVGFLLAHRFLDAGASAHSRSLQLTTCSGILCCTRRPDSDKVTLLLVDGSGARIVGDRSISLSTFRRRISKRVPDRTAMASADFEAIYATDGGRLQRITIARRSPVVMRYSPADGRIVGGRHERITLRRQKNPPDVGPSVRLDSGPQVTKGTRIYAATASALEGGISYRVPPPPVGPMAPAGYVWGDPSSVANCSRNDRDSCLSCCDLIMATYAGAAITTIVTGLVGGGPTLGTTAVVGILAGMFIGVVGLAHTWFFCRPGCDTLYYEGSGYRYHTKGYRLTHAEYNARGQQIAYVLYDESLGISAIASKDNVVQLAWAGAPMFVEAGGHKAAVKVIRRGSRHYLRSTPDKRLINNLAALPATTET